MGLKSKIEKIFGEKHYWYEDLVDYFHVTPEEALQRASYKPKTSDEYFNFFKERAEILRYANSAEDYQHFWKNIGVRSAFRQAWYHRDDAYYDILRDIFPGCRLCEYGAGIAPVSRWILEHIRYPIHITLIDIPAEHFRFGIWRIQKKIESSKIQFSFDIREVRGEGLPLVHEYDVVVIFDVFEHLVNPMAVARHLIEHLKIGGRLWMNYVIENKVCDQATPNPSNTQQAQEQWPSVFRYFTTICNLVKKKNNRYCWIKKANGR